MSCYLTFKNFSYHTSNPRRGCFAEDLLGLWKGRRMPGKSHVLSFTPHKYLWNAIISFPFDRWENWSSKRFNNLPKVTQMVSEARLWNQVSGVQMLLWCVHCVEFRELYIYDMCSFLCEYYTSVKRWKKQTNRKRPWAFSTLSEWEVNGTKLVWSRAQGPSNELGAGALMLLP